MSKLIANRKKATIVVSKRTLEDAVRRANILVESWMGANASDPRVEQLAEISAHLTQYLRMSSQQMRQDGVTSVEDYFDDAIKPDIAQRIKGEVDQIAKWHDEQRAQHSGPPMELEEEDQGVGYVPDHATVMSSKKDKIMTNKRANGAGFTSDRDEKGEAKTPEKVEVPRLAAKKKKEAEDPALDATAPVTPPAAPVPTAPAPAPSPAGGGGANPIDFIPTETLIKVIQDLPKEDDFAQNKGKQDALVELTNILKNRPVLAPEQPEGQGQAPAAPAPSTAPALGGAASGAAGADASAIPAPVSASAKKRADLGDHRMDDASGTVNSGSGASAQIGQSGTTAAPEPISTNPAPQAAEIDLGGLSIAGSLDEEKTADDYRIHDYKLLGDEEGFIPTGPSDEQENPEGRQRDATSMQASFTAAAEKFVQEVAKIANNGGWYVGSGEPMEIEEDGGRTQEIGEAHGLLDDNTSISRPATTAPIKLNQQQGLKTAAGDMSTSTAVKKSDSLGNDLKKMYLDAKALTSVNDTRAVRDAVEMIFRAADAFDEATKALNKQQQQEESEAEAQELKAKNKKSHAFGGLAVAAGE